MRSLSKNNIIKIGLSLFILLSLWMTYAGPPDHFFNVTPLTQLDAKGSTYLDQTLKRAVYTYAVTRGINAAVSVIQNTDLLISPGGIGADLAVGEILDPINDLIERFSWLLVIAITSLGVQTILSEICVNIGLKYILSFAFILFMFSLWIPHQTIRRFLTTTGNRFVLTAIFVRFLFPAISIVNEAIYHHYLEKNYIQATASIDQIHKDIKDSDLLENSKTAARQADEGLLENAKRFIKDTKKMIQFDKKIATLNLKISQFSSHIVDLIVVFLLQTIIIPVFVFWLLLKMLFRIQLKQLSDIISPQFR